MISEEFAMQPLSAAMPCCREQPDFSANRQDRTTDRTDVPAGFSRLFGERKLGVFAGVPAMGLDGLGSSAYGPEAALSVLIPLGALSLGYIGWVMAPIVLLLAILFASYWQTIRAYPSNGGAYIVSKENLGTNPRLIAAAALMIDYVLNVAVGISAGVAALVSAVPSLHPPEELRRCCGPRSPRCEANR
jgi:hypothetical protein